MMTKSSRPIWQKILGFLIPLLLAALGFLGQRFLFGRPDFAERFQAGLLFPVISTPLKWLSSLIPFSLTELCAVTGPFVLIGLAVAGLIRMKRLKGMRGTLAIRWTRTLAWILASAYLLFMLMHGWNYTRLPVGQSFQLPVRDRLSSELGETITWLASVSRAAREQTRKDDQGVFQLSRTRWQTLREGRSGYQAAARIYPQLNGYVGRPKGVLLSHWWSYTGISGMYMPLLGESNINIDIPDYQLPSAILHETAHTLGFAREDEAEFIAFLAGINSPEPDFAYSVLANALVHTLNAYYGADAEGYNAIAGQVSAEIWTDFAAGGAYWKQFEGPVQEASTQVNETFLQVNRQEEGVRSYGRMVDLLLAWMERQRAEGTLETAIVVLRD